MMREESMTRYRTSLPRAPRQSHLLKLKGRNKRARGSDQESYNNKHKTPPADRCISSRCTQFNSSLRQTAQEEEAEGNQKKKRGNPRGFSSDTGPGVFQRATDYHPRCILCFLFPPPKKDSTPRERERQYIIIISLTKLKHTTCTID